MAFQLSGVVPWGRTLQEYQQMFQLEERDLKQPIAGFGDGPASFNCEVTQRSGFVTSFDPIYQFSEAQLRARIHQVCGTVMAQMARNLDRYVWTSIHTLEELKALRMVRHGTVLGGLRGRSAQGRYVCHSLPDRLPLADDSFALGLSSHFLLLYTDLATSSTSRPSRKCSGCAARSAFFPSWT